MRTEFSFVTGNLASIERGCTIAAAIPRKDLRDYDAGPCPYDATYGDAVIMAPYDEAAYSREITISVGANAESRKWKPLTMALGAFIAKLARHVEGDKDGPAYVLADMVAGQRLKTSVKTLTAIGLDIDTGMSTEAVDDAISKLGCLAIRYTTHSHNKTTTEFKKDKIVKFIVDHGPGKEVESDDTIRWFLTESQKWDPAIVASATYGGTEHTSKGIVVVVKHDPMPKNRVVIPLEVPFDISKEAALQADAMKKWAKVPTALAELMGIPLDKTGTDPSRLFFFPRHAKGREFSAAIWGGDLYDYRKLVLDDPFETLAEDLGKGKSKSVTQEGRDLGRWSIRRAHGFQIADVVEAYASDRLRGPASQGFNIECPFDEDHSNAMDPDDKACFIVNAGMGMSEVFTISCRHESCRNKTNLDMLGKMIKDEWFERDVLEDDQFSAIDESVDEETGKRHGYKEAIDALTTASTHAEIVGALELAHAAGLEQCDLETLYLSIKAATKKSLTILRGEYTKIVARAAIKRGPERSPNGAAIFPYRNEFDFHEAAKFIAAELERYNKKMGYPVYCCMDRTPVEMHVDQFRHVTFAELNHTAFWAHLTTRVSFCDNGGVLEKVPEDVARYLHEQCWRLLPPAPEVCSTPLFLADGSLLISPGYVYHPTIGVNYFHSCDPSNPPFVPEQPTQADMEHSLKWIDSELLSDFAFYDGDDKCADMRRAGRANALAFLITPFMREMIKGISPMFLIQKSSPGEGASLLAALSCMLSEGCSPKILRYSKNEDEFAKGLVAMIREATSHIFMDDVLDLDNKDLHRNTTAPVISGRLLGGSTIISRPNRFNWVATGINPRVKAESARRVVNIRLDSRMPDPSTRRFRHPDTSGVSFEDFIWNHRNEAVGHILTMIQYWIDNGQKLWTEKPFHSYSDWARNVGGVLMACGVEGFLEHLPLSSHDPEIAAHNEFAKSSVAYFGYGEVPFDDLLKFHQSRESSLVRNIHHSELRDEFMLILMRLNKRTFNLDTTQADPEWATFQISVGKSGGEMICQFIKAKNERPNAKTA